MLGDLMGALIGRVDEADGANASGAQEENVKICAPHLLTQ